MNLNFEQNKAHAQNLASRSGRPWTRPQCRLDLFLGIWGSRNSCRGLAMCCVDRLNPPPESGHSSDAMACPRRAINDRRSMSEGFDHTHFHDTCATVEEPSTASLIDTWLAVANKPGSSDSR